MSDLNLQVRLSAMDKLSAPFKKMSNSAKALEKGLLANKEQLRKLQKVAENASAFQKSSAAAKQAEAQLSILNATIDKHRQKQEATKAIYHSVKKEYDAIQLRVDKRKKSVAELSVLLAKEKSATTKNAEAISSLTNILGRERAALSADKRVLSEKKKSLKEVTAVYQKQKKRAEELSLSNEKLRKTFNKEEKKAAHLKFLLKEVGISTSKLSLTQFTLKQNVDKTNASIAKQTQKLEKLRKRQQANQKWIGRGQKLGGIASGTSMVGFGTSHAGQSILRGLGKGVSVVTGMVDTAKQFERFETVLKTTEGSSAKAKKAMTWVSDFAVKTPYELEEVTDAFVKLRAYGMDPTSGLMTTLGDTASAMGRPISEAVEAIADAVTGENERLKGFGITSSTKKNTITYSYTDSKGLQREVKVDKRDRKMIQEKLEQIWNEKYGGAMKNQSEALVGLLSNLSDQWSRFQNMIMKSGAFDSIKKKIQATLDTINAMAESGELQAWADDVAEVLVNLAQSAWEMIKSFAQGAKDVVNWAREHKKMIAMGLKFAAVLGMVLTVLGPVILSIGTLVGSLSMLSFIMGYSGLAGAFVGFGTAIMRLGTGAIVTAYKGLQVLVTALIRLGTGAIATAYKGLQVLVTALIRLGTTAIAAAYKGLTIFIAKLYAFGVAALATAKRAIIALASAFVSLGKTILRTGLMLLTNPIFLAIAAVAAGAYLIYKNWDWLKEKFAGIWQHMSQWGSKTWDLLKTDTIAGIARITAALVDWSPVGLIYKAFAGVMNYFGVEMPARLSQFISQTGSRIMNAILAWNPAQWMRNVFASAFAWVDNKLTSLANAFGLLSNKIDAQTAAKRARLTMGQPLAIASGVTTTAKTAMGSYKLGQQIAHSGMVKNGWDSLKKAYKAQQAKASMPQVMNAPAMKVAQDASRRVKAGTEKISTRTTVATTINNDNKKNLQQINNNTYHVHVTEQTAGRKLVNTISSAADAATTRANNALLGDTH